MTHLFLLNFYFSDEIAFPNPAENEIKCWKIKKRE